MSSIARLRKRLSLTQRELADRIGVTETTIRNWENDRSGAEWLQRVAMLCQALKCKPSDLCVTDSTDKKIPGFDCSNLSLPPVNAMTIEEAMEEWRSRTGYCSRNQGFPGVYCVTDQISGSKYIGASVNVCARFSMHESAIRTGKKHPWSGLEHPPVLLLQVLEITTDLRNREDYWMGFLRSQGCNLANQNKSNYSRLFSSQPETCEEEFESIPTDETPVDTEQLIRDAVEERLREKVAQMNVEGAISKVLPTIPIKDRAIVAKAFRKLVAHLEKND